MSYLNALKWAEHTEIKYYQMLNKKQEDKKKY